MLGLQYLSDGVVVQCCVENPYRQQCCGLEYFQCQFSFASLNIASFRKRVGAEGRRFLLKVSLDAGLDFGVLHCGTCKCVVEGATVMEKTILQVPTERCATWLELR